MTTQSDEQVRRDFETACPVFDFKMRRDKAGYTSNWTEHCFKSYKMGIESCRPEIDRLKGELEASKKDSLTLAMRLYGEPEDSFAPETAEVMARKRIEIEKYMEGK